jgi:hypothetical protein
MVELMVFSPRSHYHTRDHLLPRQASLFQITGSRHLQTDHNRREVEKSKRRLNLAAMGGCYE